MKQVFALGLLLVMACATAGCKAPRFREVTAFTITVPDDYNSATQLGSFAEKHQKDFFFYDRGLTDVNFPTPTHALKAGDKLRVRVFEQVVATSTTTQERLTFLRREKAVLVGAQGASLVWDECAHKLPPGLSCASFDEPKALWRDPEGNVWVPCVGCYPLDKRRIRLCKLDKWDRSDALLCFTPIN